METRIGIRRKQTTGAPANTDLRPWELCWSTDGKLYIGVGDTDGHATSVQQTSSGDVSGPSSATSGNFAVFDGTTGKIIKDGGAVGTLSAKDDAAYNSTYYARRYQSWYALGSVVTYSIGTSGGNVPLLSGTNTWSGKQTLSGGIGLGGSTSQYVRGDGSLATLPSSTLIAYTTGDDSAFGVDAMISILSPGTNQNTAIGSGAMKNMVASGSFGSGRNNTAVGYQAMFTPTATSTFECFYNAAFGTYSAYSLTTGSYNAAFGMQSAYSLTTGSSNAAFGYQAGRYVGSGTTANQTPEKGVFLGYDCRASADGNTNEIVIGADAIGNGSNTATIGSSSTTDTYLAGTVHASELSPARPTSAQVTEIVVTNTTPSSNSANSGKLYLVY